MTDEASLKWTETIGLRRRALGAVFWARFARKLALSLVLCVGGTGTVIALIGPSGPEAAGDVILVMAASVIMGVVLPTLPEFVPREVLVTDDALVVLSSSRSWLRIPLAVVQEVEYTWISPQALRIVITVESRTVKKRFVFGGDATALKALHALAAQEHDEGHQHRVQP